MDPEDYGMDVFDFDSDIATELDEDEEDIEAEEIDEMLEAMMDEADGDEDYAERRRRRRRKRRARGRRGVKTASGKSTYRTPVTKAYVTQKQLKDALARVGVETKRNALGIKSVNSRIGKLNGRVDGVVSASTAQGKSLGKLNRLMKMDGALEFAESLTIGPDGALGIDPYRVFRGAVKSGMLGDGKGAFGNPLVVGGIGVLLNRPQVLGGVLGR